ncbi:hypothetical protein C2G38_2252988 [Gigaspora rosea]|uniref:BRCT domain-containing protein n=1 Tax=Gigaspora rosea TaxID=44941 RepID=A0A397U9I4_9GLOM|nr:hypothetical protein C2G38_2252988 [Gigaspora rosea]
MASEDEENTCPTNPVALSMSSKREDLISTTSFESSANNNNDNEENQRISSQLSSSFYSGMDSLNILSSQENDILLDADPIDVKNKKRTFDNLLEEKSNESHDIQLSSYSFQPLKRKTRKVMYKITNEKEITSSGNKKIRHDSSTHTSRSMLSQKATIVTSERIHSGPSKTTRGKKKKSTRETASSRNIGSPLNPVGVFSNLRFFFIPNDIVKVRLRLLKEKVIKKGGQVVDGEFDPSATHVITALQGRIVLKIFKILGICEKNVPQGIIIVDPNWISECLMASSTIDDFDQVQAPTSDTQKDI